MSVVIPGSGLTGYLENFDAVSKDSFQNTFHVDGPPGQNGTCSQKVLELRALVEAHKVPLQKLSPGLLLPAIFWKTSSGQPLHTWQDSSHSFYSFSFRSFLGLIPHAVMNTKIPFSQYHQFSCGCAFSIPLQSSTQTIKRPAVQTWNIWNRKAPYRSWLKCAAKQITLHSI